MSEVELVCLRGNKILAIVDHIARLRIDIFREWPYLYDGDLEYEQDYLSKFANSKNSFVVVAKVNEQVIGISTSSPMSDHHDDFAKPFLDANLSLKDYYYFGESVLRKEYRGRGIGRRFFHLREQEAKRIGYQRLVFCAVVREEDDPRRPADYRPLNPFWESEGFRCWDALVTQFDWRELGESEESQHSMQFWIKEIA